MKHFEEHSSFLIGYNNLPIDALKDEPERRVAALHNISGRSRTKTDRQVTIAKNNVKRYDQIIASCPPERREAWEKVRERSIALLVKHRLTGQL